MEIYLYGMEDEQEEEGGRDEKEKGKKGGEGWSSVR